jgi:SAM-dependent methyltransferase
LSAPLPLPTPELAARIGGTYDDYDAIARHQRQLVMSLLPSEWSFEGKSVLDFGCGTGRTLSAFAKEAEQAEFFGCDIHAPSIAWATSKLSPPFTFFVCQETPPLAQPDERFDLVYAMSVFTHITDQWSQWLAELHRVMRPSGIAVISALGPAMANQILGSSWDERIGMARLDLQKSWDIGGPNVLLAEWWVREHWGRGFEILRFQHADPASGAGHDLVAMRRRQVDVTPEFLAEVDPTDPREYASIACNLELVLRQQTTPPSLMGEPQADASNPDADLRAIRAEKALRAVTDSKSWRLTEPLRRAAAFARGRG